MGWFEQQEQEEKRRNEQQMMLKEQQRLRDEEETQRRREEDEKSRKRQHDEEAQQLEQAARSRRTDEELREKYRSDNRPSSSSGGGGGGAGDLSCFLIPAVVLVPIFLFGIGYVSILDIKSGAVVREWSINALIHCLPLLLIIGATSMFAVRQRCSSRTANWYLVIMIGALLFLGPERAVFLGYMSFLPLLLLKDADDSDKGQMIGLVAICWLLVAAGGMAGSFDLFPSFGNASFWRWRFGASLMPITHGVETVAILTAGFFTAILCVFKEDLLGMFAFLMGLPACLAAEACLAVSWGTPPGQPELFSLCRVVIASYAVAIMHADVLYSGPIWTDKDLLSKLQANKLVPIGFVLMIIVENCNLLGLLPYP